MRSLLGSPVIPLVALMLLIFAPTPAAAQMHTCTADSDFAIGLRDHAVRMVTATDSLADKGRARWALPQTTAEAVSLVTDPPICAAAAAAYHKLLRPTEPPRSRSALVVIQVGDDRFLVADPDDTVPESHYLSAVVFDGDWKRLAHLTI